jgi:hypothetical protein
MAVKNNHIRRRWTWLAHRLAGEDGAVNTRMLPDPNARKKRRSRKDGEAAAESAPPVQGQSAVPNEDSVQAGKPAKPARERKAAKKAPHSAADVIFDEGGEA